MTFICISLVYWVIFQSMKVSKHQINAFPVLKQILGEYETKQV